MADLSALNSDTPRSSWTTRGQAWRVPNPSCYRATQGTLLHPQRLRSDRPLSKHNKSSG